MRIRRLTGTLGAEIEGLQLETITDHEFKELDDALLAHQVVFLRGQHLSEDGHRSLAARFGTPSVFPLARHFGGTEELSHIEDTETNGPDADTWHTDITWIDAPPKVAILAALDIPEYGGDTLWVDLYGAYEHLSPAMRTVADGLRVRHSQGEAFWAAFGKRAPADVVDALRVAFPGAEHPLVRTHPVTGRKALFVAGSFMESIVGMDADESAWLLDHFRRRVDESKLQMRWSWRVGDVAIWDERCTNHRALGDHFPQHRLMRRCTVDGEIPV
ncbi:MAG: putative taurine dioxygenase [Ilumatobacteraceae bacterium]|nr:putative taurine dioxygenase [Ilumatobacteraceae bacterium]